MKIVVFPCPGRRAEPGPFAALRARGAFGRVRGAFGWVRGALGWARGAFGLAAALVGSVIGAGFLSGAELVRFFPAQGILPHAAVAAGLFFLCFWMLYRVGGACGGFAGVLARLGRAGPLLRAALLASSFVLCAGMLAGLHSLAREGAGVGLSFPLLSLLALPLLYGLSGRGMRGLYAADALLVPLILLFVAANAGGALRSVQPAPAGAASSLAGVCLYVCMNAFLAAPVVCDAGAARGAGGWRGGGAPSPRSCSASASPPWRAPSPGRARRTPTFPSSPRWAAAAPCGCSSAPCAPAPSSPASSPPIIRCTGRRSPPAAPGSRARVSAPRRFCFRRRG